jgi:thiamine biosynthesis protein ThiC
MKELEIKKPIGDFIIKNAKGTQTENGVYYHYSEVCTLLKSYEKQLTLTDVVVPKGTLVCDNCETKLKAQYHTPKGIFCIKCKD